MEEKLLITGSVTFFVVGIAYCLIGLLLGKERRKKWKVSPFVGLATGTICAVALLYYNGYGLTTESFLERILMTLLGTIGTLTGANDVEVTREQVSAMGKNPTYLFAIYTAALHLATSSVAIAVILKIVDVFFPMVRYLLCATGRLYVFSAINERGLLLAKDIHKKNKRAKIVFLNNGKDVDAESLVKRAQELSAYVFPYDVKDLKKPLFIKDKNIDYFLLKENHSKNVDDALGLATVYEKEKDMKKKPRIHILSEEREIIALLDASAKESKCVFRLINEARMIVYNLLDEIPLYYRTEKHSDILVIGAGRNGIEAVKACSWCGYTLKMKPNIYVIDKEIAIKAKLEKEAPEMMAIGNIHYEQIDVDSPEFIEFLREHQNIGYVICAIGDDHLNLRVAMDVRGVSYEVEPFDLEEGKLPVIAVLLTDEFLAETACRLTFSGGKSKSRSYELHPYGTWKSFYTWENICASKLEAYGLAVDFHYDSSTDKDKFFRENFYTSNYNRASSIASGLHAKYRQYAVSNESIGNTVEDEKLALAKLEHERWNAYMRSEGWRSGDGVSDTSWREENQLNDHRNFAAKIHMYITDWKNLTEEVKEYDIRLARGTEDIVENAKAYKEMLEQELR